jgi:hypothetical protein
MAASISSNLSNAACTLQAASQREEKTEMKMKEQREERLLERAERRKQNKISGEDEGPIFWGV